MDEKFLKLIQAAIESDPKALQEILEIIQMFGDGTTEWGDEGIDKIEGMEAKWRSPGRISTRPDHARAMQHFNNPMENAWRSLAGAMDGTSGGVPWNNPAIFQEAAEGAKGAASTGWRNLNFLTQDLNNRASAVTGVGDLLGTAMSKAGAQYGDENNPLTQSLRYLTGMQGIGDWTVKN